MIPFHPLADIFPLIEGKDFDELVSDIRVHGLREPIVLIEGKILDGRNRYRACVAAGILPESLAEITAAQIKLFRHMVAAGQPAPPQAELLEFVWSKNWHRRQLTPSQRAIVIADYEAFRHGGARRVQDANLHLDGLEPEPDGPTRAELSDRGQVSERLLASAAVVRDHAAPEVKEAVRRGDIAVTAAEEISHKPADEQRAILEALPRDESGKLTKDARKALAPVIKEIRAEKQIEKKERREEKERELGDKQRALPDRKFGIILADPEWPFDVWSEETGQDRAAANHYPTSTIEVIKSRPVASIAADECVLGLWATVPKLPAALDVMREWGFTYVSQIVWVKDRIGTGYWFRNNHEILLIGKKGAPPKPADGTQWRSAIEAPRAAHSEKPDFQYAFFETFFPSLPKIELNARRRREGWEAWGLEAPEDGKTVEEAA
jgi:N6-adenosine-specific RNA methylase IME4